MKIVIRSFKREKIIRDRTLKLLEKHKIPKDIIDIIVETDLMKINYEKVLGYDYNIIVSNTKGICEKRNFIRYYYRNETDLEEIMCIDDDIKDVKAVFGTVNLLDLINRGFEFARKAKANLWGINHLNNPFFMKKQKPLLTKLTYIQGGFCGIIIDRSKESIVADVDCYEDFQFSCEHYLRDGAILKLNHFYIETEYDENVGGIREALGGKEKRIDESADTAIYMLNRYGNMLRLKNSKRYGVDLFMNPYYKSP